MTICSSILACRIPWTEEPAGLQSKGLHRSGHDWKTKHRSMKRNKTLVWVSELAWKITYRIVSISFYFVFHIYLFFFQSIREVSYFVHKDSLSLSVFCCVLWKNALLVSFKRNILFSFFFSLFNRYNFSRIYITRNYILLIMK